MKCTPEKKHAIAINAARKVKPWAPRPKAKKFEKVAIIKNLKKWQDHIEMLEFKSSRLIQSGSCRFFLAENIMKSISKDATTFVNVNDLWQAVIKWPAK